jgi:cytochrome c oxidase cbb3-type subunit III
MKFVGWLVLSSACAEALFAQAGPMARPKIDSEAAGRGRALYLQHCINCHGTLAQGTDEGPDLVRSATVLRDRFGSELGPAMKRLANHKNDFSEGEIVDLSNFLKGRVEYTAQNRSASRPPNVLTGNAAAGQTWFTGAGKCTACHAVTGDLAGIGKRYDPVTVQQRFLFPRARPIAVTVSMRSGPRVSGVLDRLDDFSVSLRDGRGVYRSFVRGPGVDVKLDDPLESHHELLDRIGDDELHNVVAYLVSLQ